MLPEEIFTLRGYRKIVTAQDSIIAYFAMEEWSCKVIIDIDYHDAQKCDARILRETVGQIDVFLRGQGIENLEYLYIVNTYSELLAKELMQSVEAMTYWVYDTYTEQLHFYPDEIAKGYKPIYDCMVRYIAEGEDAVTKTESEKAKWFSRKALFSVNNLLILINIMVFLWLEFQGSTSDSIFMLEHGVLYWPYVEKMHQYYRVLSSMFMHFGVGHLLNNMLVLFFIGATLERALGKRKYALLYLGSGVAANLISGWFYTITNSPTMTCGASGAIFGVAGGLLYVVIRNKGHYEDLSSKRMILFVILSIYTGFTNTQINLVAHLSGLIVGVLMALILYRFEQDRELTE